MPPSPRLKLGEICSIPRMMVEGGGGLFIPCPVSIHRSDAHRVFEVVASKWATSILRCLATGNKRPLELMELIEGVSQKMLTQTLRRMEAGGLVARKVHAVVPPRVDYSLTPLGASLIEPLEMLERWAESHRAEIDALGTKGTAPHKKSAI